MKKSSKPSPSPRGIAKNKKKSIIIFSIAALAIVSLSIIGIKIYRKKATNQNQNTNYYTGSFYTANQAANMLDTMHQEQNIMISPFNLHSTLAILYNGTDNNTNKEIKKYFKVSPTKVNEEMQTKLASLKNEKQEETKFTKLYETYMQELKEAGYTNLSASKIRLLSKEEKEKLQLLLKKITLTYERINNKNNLSEKNIKEYKLEEKAKITNEYTLQNLLEEALDRYETYSILNKAIDYHEIFTDNNLETKDIYTTYLENTKIYNHAITPLDFSDTKETFNTINNKVKEVTDNKITRVVEEKEIHTQNIMVNTFYFNYEWEQAFKANHVKNEKFFKSNGEISQVEMMYSKETKYLENAEARGFVKDFQNSDYSFVGILPKKEGEFTLSSLNIDGLLSSVSEESITIGLPKFSIQSEINLKDIWTNYGINEVFSTKANFTKITDADFQITKNVQKIDFQVGEKGTVSTEIAKTSLEVFTEELNDKKVILNRPFCFLVINNQTNDILLIGKIESINDK